MKARKKQGQKQTKKRAKPTPPPAVRKPSRRTAARTQMRSGRKSLRKASKAVGISPRTVLKRAGSAIRKKKTGRYAVKKSDKLIRQLRIPTPDGVSDISVRNSTDASRLGRYWSRLHKYLATGDLEGLRKFEGQSIVDAKGKRFYLITDTDILDDLAYAHVLSFESLYTGE